MIRRALALVLLAGLALPAAAHRASDAFLTLQLDGSRLHGAWEIALRDADVAVRIDADGDRAITWGELRAAEARLARLLPRFLEVESAAGACAVTLGDVQVSGRGGAPNAWLALEARCEGPPLRLRYGFLFEIDPSHRAIAVLTTGGATVNAVLSPGAPQLELAAGPGSAARTFTDYLRAGIHHIWIGLDHVLFLVTLLLPAVLVPRAGGWRGAERAGPVAWSLLRVVTAFTVAHSLTLALVALDVVRLPGALVESAIAASVIAAALNNLRPHAAGARTGMAFAFGLVHGCGLASALGELGLPAQAQLLALAAFNLGVEAGQLAIVAAVLPVAFLLRDTRLYRHGLVAGGSLGIAALGTFWLLERSGLLAGGAL